MIFVTGPMYSGKREYISSLLGIRSEELSSRAVWDVQNLAEGDLVEAYAMVEVPRT